jgi:hypothetical protein
MHTAIIRVWLVVCTSAVVFARQKSLRDLYLQTIKQSVSGNALQTPSVSIPYANVTLPYNHQRRLSGTDWPLYGQTMIGLQRLDNLEHLILLTLKRRIPGDFVECGVWRGGASILAKAVFTAYRRPHRVHVVDSFQGLPRATQDLDNNMWSQMTFLRVSQDEVQANFNTYGLFDDRVVFHKGFFRYALPQLVYNWPSLTISVLRMVCCVARSRSPQPL